MIGKNEMNTSLFTDCMFMFPDYLKAIYINKLELITALSDSAGFHTVKSKHICLKTTILTKHFVYII